MKTKFKFLIISTLFLTGTGALAQSWDIVGSPISDNIPSNFYYAEAKINANGTVAVIGAKNGEDPSTDNSFVEVYELINDQWTLKGDRLLGDACDESFGDRVDINSTGDRILVSASHADCEGTNNSGSVTAFEWTDSEWVQMGNKISGNSDWDLVGEVISMNADGDIIAFSDNEDTSSKLGNTKTKVFQFDGSGWIQMGSDLYMTDFYFGDVDIDLSHSGLTIAIGGGTSAAIDDGGEVGVYDWNGSEWQLKGDYFFGYEENLVLGKSLAINGDGNTVAISTATVLFGSDLTLSCTKVYNWDGSVWVQQGEDFIGDYVGGISESGHRVFTLKRESAYVWDLRVSELINGNWELIGEPLSYLNYDFKSPHGISNDGSVIITQARNDNGSNIESVLIFSTNEANAINEQEVSSPIKIYPNPSSNQIVLKLQNDSFRDILIIDMQGKIVLTQNSNKNQSVIDISTLNTGIYTVKAISSTGQVFSQLLQVL